MDTGRIYSSDERKGIAEGDYVYELRHDRYNDWRWNLLHWAWCWLRLRPHMVHWQAQSLTIDQWWLRYADRESFGPMLRKRVRKLESPIVKFQRWWLLRIGNRKLGSLLLNLYLHFFYGYTVDLALHNHPATSYRLVLRGGYEERVLLPDGSEHTRRVKAWSLKHWRMGTEVWHRITKVEPGTITLFLMAGRYRDWETAEGRVR